MRQVLERTARQIDTDGQKIRHIFANDSELLITTVII